MKAATLSAAVAALGATCAPPPAPGVCQQAQARLGHSVCADQVQGPAEWLSVSLPVDRIDQRRESKYLVPATDAARLPALLLDVNAYRAHFTFLTEAFAERFAALDLPGYEALITDPARREFFAGLVTEFVAGDRTSTYGAVVWDQQTAEGTLSCAEFQLAHRRLSSIFGLRPLAIVPSTAHQRHVLARCEVPTFDPGASVRYERYTGGVGFGYLRRLKSADLAAAIWRGDIGPRDLLVLDEAPLDIETVISGAVTGTRQGELSHLNVRSAARGTPNCFVADAYALAEPWVDKLVRIECGRDALTIAAATASDAEAGWARLRPAPVTLAPVDASFSQMPSLHQLPTVDLTARQLARSRFGGKGTQLAILYQRIPTTLQLEGFLIPFHPYLQFLASNRWNIDLDSAGGAGPEDLSFADTIARLRGNARLSTDAAWRRQTLSALAQAMRSARCDPTAIESIAARIGAVVGRPEVMVRFRSSSNAEDSLRFSGAGLYESVSVCAADDLDADEVGPSRCDASEPNERGICRGLKRVWSSLWEPKAFEERDWYGIDHSQSAMAVLVTLRTASERANGVAFTGNPLARGDGRYLVNAQKDDVEVVGGPPGVFPESDLLTLSAGVVTAIERARRSSLAPTGDYVLSDVQLKDLGGVLAHIQSVYPVDEAPPEGRRVLLDTEWKVLADGRLIVKQVRPFLTTP